MTDFTDDLLQADRGRRITQIFPPTLLHQMLFRGRQRSLVQLGHSPQQHLALLNR
ncbi:MAG: hypothetical protein HYV75_09455 [Opitutae bacterium]|nr:hypothetical protein [Opitutae bacterium]